MKEKFESTKIVCGACRTAHPARHRTESNQAYWIVDCPRGEQQIKMSTDAALFDSFRRDYPDSGLDPMPERRYSNIILHITDKCSLHCPVCFATAKDSGWEIDLADLRRRAEKIRAYRPTVVMLSGGEPTEHPKLLEIIRILSKEYHCMVSMLTNGVRIGEDPEYAAKLKEAGLRKASISLDTLQAETHAYLRGGGPELLERKKRALQHCRDVGLNAGIVATLCNRNLPELGELLKFVFTQRGSLSVLDLQCLQESGRFPPDIVAADREQIIRALVDSGIIKGLRPDHFMATPPVPSAGFLIHPDCGAGLFLLVDKNGQASLLEDRIPFRNFSAALARGGTCARRFPKLWLFAQTWHHLGWRGFLWARRFLWGGTWRGESILLLAITTLMKADKLDCERIKRCANAVMTGDGILHPCCFYYAYEYPPKPAPENKENSP